MARILPLSCLLLVSACDEATSPSTLPNVGYQELVLVDSARGRTLRTAFWYPVDAGGTPDRAGGPYPLILYSHGDHCRSSNGQGTWWSNGWASRGFVVAAPDHQKNTSYDFDDSDANRAAIQFDRPKDIRFVTDQALALNSDSKSFLFGMIDPQAIGTSGASFGGHTTNMVAGATPNLDHLADWCAASPDNAASWDVCGLQDRIQELYPGRRVIDESDVRMKAALALVPDGYGWFLADGMAKIRIPMMFMGGLLDTIAPVDTQVRPEYQGVQSAKYLYIINQADHFVFGDWCSKLSPSACAAVRDQIVFLSTAFWQVHLKGDRSYVDLMRDYASSQPDTMFVSEPATSSL